MAMARSGTLIAAMKVEAFRIPLIMRRRGRVSFRCFWTVSESRVQEAAYFGNDFWDNISVNVSREGFYLFNNRGTHRLCIAKAMGIESVPVIVIVKHASYVEKQVDFRRSKRF